MKHSSSANSAVFNNYARSNSLMDMRRSNSKEAEDAKKHSEKNEEDELIILRRKISLLNAQHGVQARDHMEALETKDREILNLQNEITNLQQTVARERLSRKNAEERVETLESEVQKLKRLALAYKTKLVKSNLGGSMDFSKTNPIDDTLPTPRDITTPRRDVGIPRMEVNGGEENPTSTSEPNRLVSSLSTGCVPDSQPLVHSFISSSSANPYRKKSLSDLLAPNQILEFPYDLNGIPLQTTDTSKLLPPKPHPLASSLAPPSANSHHQPPLHPLSQSQRSPSTHMPSSQAPPPLPAFPPPSPDDSFRALSIPSYNAPPKIPSTLPPPLPSLPPSLPPSSVPPSSLPPPPSSSSSLLPSYPAPSPRNNHAVPVTLSRSISNNSFKLSQSLSSSTSNNATPKQ